MSKKNDNVPPKWQTIPPKWIYNIEEDYAPNTSMFSDDNEQVATLKKIIYNDLDEIERRIILAYAEIGNLRETAQLFKVSTSTIYKQIKKIREKIKICLRK